MNPMENNLPSPGQTSSGLDSHCESEGMKVQVLGQMAVPTETLTRDKAPTRCSVCGAEREDRQLSIHQEPARLDRAYCNDNPACIAGVKFQIATELYFVEVIKPNGSYAVQVPMRMDASICPVPMPMLERIFAEKSWDDLMKLFPDMPIPEGTIFRLVRFKRAEELREYISPSSAQSMAA